MNTRMQRQQKPFIPLILALQYYDGDQEQAADLVELICDLEPEKRLDAEFVLASRRGCDEEMTQDMLKRLKRRFAAVHHVPGHGFAHGWPHGCNELWVETMMGVSMLKRAGKTTATGMFTFEADCVPVAKDWVGRLRSAWIAAQGEGFQCMGSLCENPVHINGNAVFEIGLTRQYPELINHSATSGWDVDHAKLLTEIGTGTDLIAQSYRAKILTPEMVAGAIEKGAVLLHGVKDPQLVRKAAEFLLFASNVRQPQGDPK